MPLLKVNEDTFKYFKDEQPSNICFISVTSDVSKKDKSNEVNNLHPKNILSIFIASDVLLKNFIDFNELQPLNKYPKLVTFSVFKGDKSTEVKEVQ